MKTIVQNRSISLRFLPIRAVQTVEACPGKAFIYRIPHIRQDCKHIPHINMQLLFVSDMRKKSTGIAHCVRIREAVCQIMCRLSHLVIITHRQFLPFPQHAVHPVDKKTRPLRCMPTDQHTPMVIQRQRSRIFLLSMRAQQLKISVDV